jgi:redox-sensitive bicupin YhaK (pirin superfamily)
MSAGRGIQHSELNASRTAEVHFLQMWVVPDRYGIEPGYEQIEVGAALRTGALVPVASGRGHTGAVHLHQAGAVMWVAQLAAGSSATLPDAPFVHLYVAAGTAVLGDHRLETGAAVRLWSAGNPTLTAEGDCEIVVWETDAEAR